MRGVLQHPAHAAHALSSNQVDVDLVLDVVVDLDVVVVLDVVADIVVCVDVHAHGGNQSCGARVYVQAHDSDYVSV